MWKERVLLHLGWMDIDYAIRKDEPPTVTDISTEAEIALYEHWKRSNRLSVMFIKTKISVGIRGSIDQHTKVRDLLKAIDEQFVTSDKALASTLIMKFCSTKLDTVRGVREHIMKMRDTAAQLKKLEGKQTNKSTKGATRSSHILEIITTDICSPDMDSHGQRYFVSFIDNYSRYMYLYLLHNKNEVLDAFKVFKAEVEKQCGKQIKIMRSDKGREYYGRYTEDGQAHGPFARELFAYSVVRSYPSQLCRSYRQLREAHLNLSPSAPPSLSPSLSLSLHPISNKEALRRPQNKSFSPFTIELIIC
ncbi:hypothetical protein F0562_012590 [Nyssa sinensis]|uniref:Integrase catalytic domain-containing protein n=1 Tax=Nyssa sinensis TaxID=561372 RepID=A0A5J4ZWF5_9ASTE|nr:hypothetical protein F0562_012590 [Nyssa sinensis]